MIDIAEDQNLNEDNDTPEQKKPGALGSLWLFVWDFLKIFIIALAIIIPIRFYLFQPFIVTGQSMLPNFEDGQYLVIDEISYRFTSPQRGEVTVIRSPNDDSQFFIKRIIGLPGETIEISNGSVIIKNSERPLGFVLDEAYLPQDLQTFGNTAKTLKANEYFVLGDNRIASSDSRVFGPIQEETIVGRVFIRAFPISDFDKFNAPEYHY